MKTTTKLALAGFALAFGTGAATAATTAENWDNLCASCHGTDGKAQTKMGKKLKLRDYTSAAVQAELKDDAMLKATTDGVTVEGKEKMKGYKADLSAAEIKDLVAHIRKFKV
ncbi:MAG: cytochrome c [Lacunisphaera sp.]|nr:cytochrome c [Lacunisphaera sp.]